MKRLLIFITGKQGAGKGYVASECARTGLATHIDVDRILGASEIPEHGGLSLTNWDRWNNASQAGRKECIERGLNAVYGDLKHSPTHLIIEGAILCNEWFTEPLESVLRESFDVNFVVSNYYINVSNADILRNIRVRAEADPVNRGHEQFQFPDEHAIAGFHVGFDQTIKGSRRKWEHFD